MSEKKGWRGDAPQREIVDISKLKEALKKPEEPTVPKEMRSAVPKRAETVVDPDDSGIHDIEELRRMAREATETED